MRGRPLLEMPRPSSSASCNHPAEWAERDAHDILLAIETSWEELFEPSVRETFINRDVVMDGYGYSIKKKYSEED